ncbi:hypothetical protein [Flavobacterium sp. LB2P6]|uniref:hypothetical protein n=1 Tax=Flavobacterium sp. LB2P6 TaxID=3401714 RepID=UPI003AACDC48
MNQFGLIIHETTAGSNLQFISRHLDVNSPEIKETITDERTLASQLANMSDVYAVQITKNYKVYSLIITNHTDFLGRSGFYAIRLYGPKGLNLMNFEKNLSDIKDRYIADTTSNNLNNQNYDDILSSILIVENNRKDFISLKNNANCFYYFDGNTSTLSTVFNTKGINLVHKVYAFNKTQAVPENIALSTGLKSYSQINTSQKEINIVNNYSILKELKINNENIDFNPNVSDFNLICQSSDSVLYNTTDDKNFRQIANNFISIERKYVPRSAPRPTPSHGGNKKTFWEENGIYLGILLLTVMIAGGSYYYFEVNNSSAKYQQENYSNSQSNKNLEPNDSISKSENTFELLIENRDSLYKPKYQNLEKYRFRFKDEKWEYKNNDKAPNAKDGYTDFYKETIDNIIKANPSSNFDKNKKEEFLKNLKEESGHPIKNRAVQVEENTNSNETKTSVSKGVRTPAKPKAVEPKAPKDKPDGSNI